MQQHVKTLGWIYIIFHALGLIAAIIVFTALTGTGMLVQDQEAAPILVLIGTVVGVFLAVISLPGIIGGIYLLKYENWARILVIILGILNLFNFPFGTALGIYTLYILINDETVRLFRKDSPVVQTQ